MDGATVFDNTKDENLKIGEFLLHIRGVERSSDTNTKKLSKGQKGKKDSNLL